MAVTLPQEVQDSLAFESSNRAGESVLDQNFYTAPEGSGDSPPGTLLKLEKYADTSKYLLPSTTALSRFIYQSESLLGTKRPVSAYILWPYSPRSLSDGFAVAAWAHGTSGFDANAAPSNMKHLWQHFQAPYQLALNGYVVVATDYAGFGVKKNASGEDIVHEYLAPPSQAKDVINAAAAAQSGFPELSKSFVSIGQSQGGGAVWGIAAHQSAVAQSIPGYLGGVAISPYVGLLDDNAPVNDILAANTVPAVATLFSDFRPEDVLTSEGLRKLETIHQVDAGISSAFALFTDDIKIFKKNWKEHDKLQEYQRMTSNGGKAIGGGGTKSPLLIIHGTADPVLEHDPVVKAAQATANTDPLAAIDFYSLADVTHVSAIPASQPIWLDWIDARFQGKQVPAGYRFHQVKSAQPASAHQRDQNWYLSTASAPYHAPGP